MEPSPAQIDEVDEQQPPPTAGGKSVLDHLGEEVTGIVTPVSICMALTVLLVRALNPDGLDSGTVYIASAAYHERVSCIQAAKQACMLRPERAYSIAQSREEAGGAATIHRQ